MLTFCVLSARTKSVREGQPHRGKSRPVCAPLNLHIWSLSSGSNGPLEKDLHESCPNKGGKTPFPKTPSWSFHPGPLCTCDCLKSAPRQLRSTVIPAEGIGACSAQPLPSALGFRLGSTVLARANVFRASERRMCAQNHLPGLGESGRRKTCSVWRHFTLLEKYETSTGLLFVSCQVCSFPAFKTRKLSLNLILNNTVEGFLLQHTIELLHKMKLGRVWEKNVFISSGSKLVHFEQK